MLILGSFSIFCACTCTHTLVNTVFCPGLLLMAEHVLVIFTQCPPSMPGLPWKPPDSVCRFQS